MQPVFTTLDLKPAKEISPNAGKIKIPEINSNAKWIWASDDHAPSIYCHFNIGNHAQTTWSKFEIKYFNVNIIEHSQGVIKYKAENPETSKENGEVLYEATTYQSGPPVPASYQVLTELNALPRSKEFRHTEIPKTNVETDYLDVVTTVAKNGTDELNRSNTLSETSSQPLEDVASSTGSFFG